MKVFPAFALLTLGLAVSALGQTIDPVGFCPPPATVSACTTGLGAGGENIGVGATDIGMMKNGGGGTASNPWFLLVAIPDYTGTAPTITFKNTFSPSGSPAEFDNFISTSGSLYTFTGTTGDSSMSAANMFGANELAAFGSMPSFFTVFKYTFTPDIADGVPYEFTVGGSGLAAGTYLAADGGTNPFTTPFTVAGLVDGPGCTPATCGGGGGGTPVPEPSSVVLFGTAFVIGALFMRKKVRKVSQNF